MNSLLKCDSCRQPFNSVTNRNDLEDINREREEAGLEPMEFRPPLILHQCGCTFCGNCLQQLFEGEANGEVDENGNEVRTVCLTCGEMIIE